MRDLTDDERARWAMRTADPDAHWAQICALFGDQAEMVLQEQLQAADLHATEKAARGDRRTHAQVMADEAAFVKNDHEFRKATFEEAKANGATDTEAQLTVGSAVHERRKAEGPLGVVGSRH